MNFLNSLAKPKFLFLMVFLYMALIAIMGFLKGDVEILDTKFFYLQSEIQALFHSMGDSGRLVYRQVNLVDFILIFVYTLFFIGMYISFFKELAKTLLIIPGLLFVVDLLETSLIYFLLNDFPQSHSNLELMLMLLTPLKWVLMLSSLLVVVNGYFVNLYMKKS